MEFSWEKFYDILKEDNEAMLLTIIDKKSSTPRGVDTSMIVKRDGTIFGTIGGGPVENELIIEATELLKTGKSKVVEKYFTGDSVICGGRIKVIIEYFSEKDLDFLADLIENYSSGKEVYLSRNLETFQRELLEDFIVNEKFYIQKIEARPLLYIFGGGHIAIPLVKIASLCEFKISVFDDREDFANKERFPECDEVFCVDFNNVLPYIKFSNNTFFVLITREHAHDEILLKQLLGKSSRYIGMIGSRKRVASVKQRLINSGFNKDEVEQIYAPIGLDINSETPAEIAVSIIGEIIKVKND